MCRLPKHREELVCCECTTDIEIPGRPVDTRQDVRVVPADVEEEEPLEIHIAVNGGDHHPLRCDHRVEGAWIQVHTLADLDVHRHRIGHSLKEKKNRTERSESGCLSEGYFS